MLLAYFDCASGIAGDMMLAALVDAGVDLAAIQAGVASLGLPGVRLVSAEVQRKGFRGLKIDVEHEPEHKHRHLHHIIEMIDAGRLTPRQGTGQKDFHATGRGGSESAWHRNSQSAFS